MGAGHPHRFETLRAAPWLERLDARARLVGALVLALGVAATQTREGAAIGLWIAFALVWCGGLPIAYVLARLRALLAIVVPILVLVPLARFEAGSTPLVDGWAWGPSAEGLAIAVTMSVRVVGAAIVAVIALAIGPFDRTALAMQALGAPPRLVELTLLVFRYLFCFREDLERLKLALAGRGWRPRLRASAFWPVGNGLGALVLRSLRRTERVHLAMRARGFTGRLVREAPPALRWSDLAVAALLAATGLVLALADRLWLA